MRLVFSKHAWPYWHSNNLCKDHVFLGGLTVRSTYPHAQAALNLPASMMHERLVSCSCINICKTYNPRRGTSDLQSLSSGYLTIEGVHACIPV
jgi:hypothetical protein